MDFGGLGRNPRRVEPRKEAVRSEAQDVPGILDRRIAFTSVKKQTARNSNANAMPGRLDDLRDRLRRIFRAMGNLRSRVGQR